MKTIHRAQALRSAVYGLCCPTFLPTPGCHTTPIAAIHRRKLNVRLQNGWGQVYGLVHSIYTKRGYVVVVQQYWGGTADCIHFISFKSVEYFIFQLNRNLYFTVHSRCINDSVHFLILKLHAYCRWLPMFLAILSTTSSLLNVWPAFPHATG